MRATSTKRRASPASSCCVADRDGEYIVLSRWESDEAFKAWVNSDLFKLSHRHADGELAHGSELRQYEVIDAKVPA